jgi:hypothetical protein
MVRVVLRTIKADGRIAPTGKGCGALGAGAGQGVELNQVSKHDDDTAQWAL